MRIRVVSLLLCSAALGAGGCGTREPSDEEQVRTTLSALSQATEAKDYRRLCRDVLARRLLEGIQRIGLPCEVALRQGLQDVEDPRMSIGRVDITGAKATAQVRTSAKGQTPSDDVVELIKEKAGWRVSSLAGASKPPTQPRPDP